MSEFSKSGGLVLDRSGVPSKPVPWYQLDPWDHVRPSKEEEYDPSLLSIENPVIPDDPAGGGHYESDPSLSIQAPGIDPGGSLLALALDWRTYG